MKADEIEIVSKELRKLLGRRGKLWPKQSRELLESMTQGLERMQRWASEFEGVEQSPAVPLPIDLYRRGEVNRARAGR